MSENVDPKPNKKKKRRKKKHPFLRLILFILILVGIYLFMDSSFFYIRDFDISGNVNNTSSQVINMTGLIQGKNIFFESNLKNARNGLLKSPYIKFAKLSRKLPGTIKIELEEREEFAVVPLENGEYGLIDKEGLVLRKSDSKPYLPILTGFTVSGCIPGESLQVEEKYLLTKGLNLLNAASEIDFYFERVDLSVSTVKAYIYYDQYKCEGSIDNILSQLVSIKTMVASQYTENITHGTIYVGSNGYLSYAP